MQPDEQQAPEDRLKQIRWRAEIDGYRKLTLRDGGAALALVQARADVLELLSLLQQPTSEHRCPHFQPKGEDSSGAYNAQVIMDVTGELIDGEDRQRMAVKPTSWYSLLIKQLIQRIANLRVLLHEAQAQPAGEPDSDTSMKWLGGDNYQAKRKIQHSQNCSIWLPMDRTCDCGAIRIREGAEHD